MAPFGDEGWEKIRAWTRLKRRSSTELQASLWWHRCRRSLIRTNSYLQQGDLSCWHDGVCVRGDVFRSDCIRRRPDSISITITDVFHRAPSSPDELNGPHRKAPKHKEYHYQSLLIKSDCFTKICERCRVFTVFSAALHLLPDADGLSTAAETLVMISNN